MKHVIRERERKRERNGRKRKRERERGRGTGRGRGRGTERDEEEEKEKDKEKGKDKEKEQEKAAFVKGFSFFSWLRDQLWKKMLQWWTLRANLLKWTGPSHGPVPWKLVEIVFFNKGLISDFILLGTADKHDFFPEKMSSFCFFSHSNI